MQSAAAGKPSRETGLPPGVDVAPLGARFLAYLIDISVPAVVNGVLSYVLTTVTDPTVRVIVIVIASVISLVWALLLWFRLAGKAATPGLQAMKLQLVGFYDGRPIGIGRVFLRGLVLWLLSATGIGLLIMLILMVLHPRRQGWHDQAVKAVMIKQRTLAPRPARPPGASAAASPQQLSTGQPAYSGSGQQQQPYPGGGQPQPAYPSQFAGSPPNYPQQSGPYGGPPSGQPSAPSQPVRPLTPPSGQPSRPPAGAGYPSAPSVGYSPIPGGMATPPPQQTRPESSEPPSDADLSTSATRPMSAVSAASRSGWLAVLDDGREINVDGLVLLGRNPQPQPGEEDAQLIKIADETRTVSKSHLAIGLDASGIFVVDRGSTNGSTVTTPQGVSSRCRTGEVIYVAGGSIVSIGDHWLEIRQH